MAFIDRFVFTTIVNTVIGAKVLGFGSALYSGELNGFQDPNFQDGYRYNPNDGKWYNAPPAPDVGQFGWEGLAPDDKQQQFNYRKRAAEFANDLENRSIDNSTIWDKLPGFISDLFGAASNWFPPRDPLTFDLDGDGLETVGINTAAPIYFDHDGDSSTPKTATGWVAPDDGFLVLDRNGNGSIDSGRELFGDSTPLAAGGNAVDGFAALAQEDTNLDGKVNAADARFADLRIWRDLNQDGISQAGELSTLAALGIASINVVKTENSTLLANGNVIADLGTYTKTDGSLGTIGDTAQLGDIDLASNSFISQFTPIPITAEAAALPDMQGSGQVRDLREAASLSASLVSALSSYAAGATRDAQITQLDSLLKAWSDTSTMATTATGAYAGHALTVNFAGITNGSAEHQAWLDKLTVLERFNGRTFQPVPTGTGPVTLNISSGQMNLLNQSYAALQNSVYGALVMQTRFKPLIESIDLVLTADGISLDFSGVVQTLQTRIDASPANGIKDLIDFNRFSGALGAGWDGWTMLGNAMGSVPSTVVDAVLDEMKLRVSANFNGTAGDDFAFATNGNDYLNGNAGDDVLFGLDGADTLNGGAGADTLTGGVGNDTLDGGAGNDTYVFATGAGVDVINDYDTTAGNTDVVQFADVASTGVTALERQGEHLVVKYGTADQLTLNYFFHSSYPGYKIEQIKFSDGVTWDQAGIQEHVTYYGSDSSNIMKGHYDSTNRIYGLQGHDTLFGGDLNDLLDGGADNDDLHGDLYTHGVGGDDTLFGQDGNDNLYGYEGDDILVGGTGRDSLVGDIGNDTYVFSVGDAGYYDGGSIKYDTLNDYSYRRYSHPNYYEPIFSNTDTILFNDIASTTGVELTRISNSDYLIINYGVGDILYVTGQFYVRNDAYKIEQIKFSDGVVWGLDDIQFGSRNSDTLTGSDGSGVLLGYGGNDRLIGNAGNDLLDGGAGGDTMVGGSGNDIYIVDNKRDIVTETSTLGSEIDTIQSFVTRTLDTNVENLTLIGTAVINGTGNTLNNVLKGNSVVNSLTGAAGNDTLEGFGGADTLTGGSGNDTYALGRGYAADTVVENDATAGNTDIAQFLTGVSADQIWFQKVGNNLETSIIGTSDKLVVKDWYLGTAYHVEQFKTTDGAKTLLDSNVQNLVNAMASFAPPAAGQTTLPSNYQTNLAPVIAANWQ